MASSSSKYDSVCIYGNCYAYLLLRASVCIFHGRVVVESRVILSPQDGLVARRSSGSVSYASHPSDCRAVEQLQLILVQVVGWCLCADGVCLLLSGLF
ncbi:hypothetical protein D3C81_898370 [compost metagenome]